MLTLAFSLSTRLWNDVACGGVSGLQCDCTRGEASPPPAPEGPTGTGVTGRSVDAATPIAAEAADRARGQTVQASDTAPPEDSPGGCGGSIGVGGVGEPLLGMKPKGTSPKMRPALLLRISGGNVCQLFAMYKWENAILIWRGLDASWEHGWKKGR